MSLGRGLRNKILNICERLLRMCLNGPRTPLPQHLMVVRPWYFLVSQWSLPPQLPFQSIEGYMLP